MTEINNTQWRKQGDGWVENTRKAWQEANVGRKIENGSLCKLNFRDGDNTESMWVKMHDIGNNEYIGELQNTPVLISGYKWGDVVSFEFEDIMAYLPPTYVNPESN